MGWWDQRVASQLKQMAIERMAVMVLQRRAYRQRSSESRGRAGRGRAAATTQGSRWKKTETTRLMMWQLK